MQSIKGQALNGGSVGKSGSGSGVEKKVEVLEDFATPFICSLRTHRAEKVCAKSNFKIFEASLSPRRSCCS